MVRFSEKTTKATADKEDESKKLKVCLTNRGFNRIVKIKILSKINCMKFDNIHLTKSVFAIALSSSNASLVIQQKLTPSAWTEQQWGLLGSIWHQEPHLGAQGSPPPPWHPTSAKRVNRVEERKLLPESETLWGGPQTLPSPPQWGLQQIISIDTWKEFTLSLSRCAGTPQGGGEGGYRSKPLKLTNHRSLRHHHHHRLFRLLSLCQLCFLSPALNHTAGVASERRAASASSVERALTWPAGIN